MLLVVNMLVDLPGAIDATMPVTGRSAMSAFCAHVKSPWLKFYRRFFANLRSRDDFGFGPFAGRSDANPPAFGAMPQHLPVVEYFIPFRL